jgi:hypothetical protein
VPIPFRDRSDVEDLGYAGYLRFVDEADGNGLRGALFLVNGHGEPVDFCFSRIDIPASSLWRAGESRRHGVRALCCALFTACARVPAVVLARVDEVPPLVFAEDLEVSVPIARLADGALAAPIQATVEVSEELGETLHAFWVGEPPRAESSARRLFDALSSRGLAIEPFERAAVGLEEAFAAS